MQLSTLIHNLPEYRLLNSIDVPAMDITGITADSRQVGPGSLFVAYQGVSVDGHQFISAALTQGAAAIIFEDTARDKIQPMAGGPVPFIGVPSGRQALAYLAAAWEQVPRPPADNGRHYRHRR